MELETRYNGLVEIDEKEIIEFPQGIPGFIDKKKYVLLSLHENSPFLIMQSVEEVGLAFITLSPWDVLSDYEFEINKSTEKLLGVEIPDDILVLGICTVKDNLDNMTINLTAPVLINYKKNLGKQIILETDKYISKFPVFSEQKRQEAK